MNGFTTKILHCKESKADVQGALRFPIYDCAAYEFESAEAIGMSFDGSKPAHAYSRVSNPTVEAFENRIKVISGAEHCIAFASGMAAITNVVLTLCEADSNIIASRFLFGNTVSLFEKTLGPWGLKIKWVDPTNIEEIRTSIDSKTRMVFVETISNPQIVVADVKKVALLCNEHKIPFVLDNSLATPYLLRSKEFGVSLEIVSSAKYISGGGTSIGGLVIENGNFDWVNAPRLSRDYEKFGKNVFGKILRTSVARNVGACLSPNSAYLQMLGLETLSLRIEKSSMNAISIAEFLHSHEKISCVNYPGLKDSPYNDLCKSQFTKGMNGGLLSFELSNNLNPLEFINRLQIVKKSSNFNDNKSLIIHPASTLFCEYSKEQLANMRISEQLIRFSVGIEDLDDLIADLSQALG